MAPLPIPAPNSQAVNTGGGVPSFIALWWNFFNSLLAAITTGPLGPVPLTGVTDGSNAAAGIVGEYLHSFVLSGAAVNLITGTDTQVTSLALTAGDWDLTGEVFFQPTSATLSACFVAINTTVNATPTVPTDGTDFANERGISAAGVVGIGGLRTRISITTPTTYLLIALATFSGTSVAGYGALRARRVR